MGKNNQARVRHRTSGNSPAQGLPFVAPFLWPAIAIATASTSEFVADFLDKFAHSLVQVETPAEDFAQPQWSSRNDIVLELPTMRLRTFTHGEGARTALVCAPFALHAANLTDLAPDHSLVEALHRAGLNRVYVTDWRSATPEMRHFTIDQYLADLNVVVDDIGAPVDLIGLCQGGWLGLIYAARFPAKIRRLVVAGAPVDLAAGESALSRMVKNLPPEAFVQLLRLGDGRVLGWQHLELWAGALAGDKPGHILQLPAKLDPAQKQNVEQLYREWYGQTVDLPGDYFMQVVTWLYQENRIAEGRFSALGRAIDLGDIRVPVYLLAGREDQVVAPAQLLALADRVGTPKQAIETAIEPCGHLSLFMGRQVLAGTWPKIVQWLSSARPMRKSNTSVAEK